MFIADSKMGCEIDAKGCTSQQYEGISSPDIQPVVPPEWLRSLWSSVKQLETGCLALQEVIESSIIDDQPNAPGEGGRRVNHLEKYLCEHVQEALEIDVQGSVGLWPLPERSGVIRYNTHARDVNGPHMFNLTMDWFYINETPWTSECVQILTEKFLSRYCIGDYPQVQHRLTTAGVTEVLTKYILHLKARYHREAEGFIKLMRFSPDHPDQWYTS